MSLKSLFQLSLVRVFTASFLIFFLMIGGISYQSVSGLRDVSAEFNYLSSKSLPMASANGKLIQTLLGQANILARVPRIVTQEGYAQALSSKQDNQALIEQLMADVSAFTPTDKTQQSDSKLAQLQSNIGEIKNKAEQIMMLQSAKLETIAQIKDKETSFKYGIASVGPEMSRIANSLAFDNPEAMDAANRYVASASRMESLYLQLDASSDLSAARKVYKELKTRYSAIDLAYDDFKEWHPEIDDFASLTAPFGFVKEGLTKSGVVALVLQRLNTTLEQNTLLDEIEHDYQQALDVLDQFSTQTNQQIQNKKIELNSEITNLTQFLLWLAIITVIALAIVWYQLRRWISRSLKNILLALRAIANKDLTRDIHSHGPSELNEIADNLKIVSLAMQESLNSVRSNADILNESSEATLRSANKANEQIAAQNGALQNIGSTMIEIEASIKDIARHTQDTFTESKSAVSHSAEGQVVLDQNLDRLSSLDSSLDVNDAAMNELDESVQKIVSIVDVISGIAENTNLLALNAAIEAARAGEQGRGFAVVADEVRKLASDTSSQTSSIRNLITGLVESVGRSRNASNESREQMSQALSASNSLRNAFHNIEAAIAKISAQVEEISVAAAQQEQATIEVNQTISQISDQAHETAQSVDKMLERSSKVASIAHDQQNMLSTYQL